MKLYILLLIAAGILLNPACSKTLQQIQDDNCHGKMNPHTYYDIGFFSSCKECDSRCATCTGSSTHCLTCYPGYVMSDSFCYPNPCNGSLVYEPESHRCSTNCTDPRTVAVSKVCVPCDSSCLTCSGPGPNECTSCEPKFWLEIDNSCQKCDSSCYTCSTGGPNACVECQPFPWKHYGSQCVYGQKCPPNSFNYEANNTCLPNCPDNFFNGNWSSLLNDYAPTCMACSDACATCNVTNGKCLTCVNPKHKTSIGCGQQCPNELIIPLDRDNVDNYTCQAPPCPFGYYQKSNFECAFCNTSCAACNGPSYTNCTLCNDTLVRLPNNTCVISCPDGTFNESGTCIQCDEFYKTCATCNGRYSNNCLTCMPGLLYFRPDSKCLPQCPSGYYNVLGNCSSCHSSCVTCYGSSSTSCSSCAAAYLFDPSTQSCMDPCPSTKVYFALNKSCLDRCPDGTQNFSSECLSCDPTCSNCSGPTAGQCTSCPATRVYYETANRTSSCQLDCPEGYYNNSGNCKVCHSSCGTCNGPSNTSCLSCLDSKLLLNNSCVTSCPSGYVAQENNCLDCPDGCKTCSGPFQGFCQSCIPGYTFQIGFCFRSCSLVEGFYDEAMDELCRKCDLGCSICEALSPTICLYCVPDFVYYPSNSSCLQNCPHGYYNNFGRCESCNSGNYSGNNSCGSRRLASLNCDSSCETCDGPLPTNCLSCPSNAAYFIYNSSCLPSCPSHFYNNAGVCSLCDISCSTCNGPLSTNCMTCPSTSLVYFSPNSSCLGNCPDGYYNNSGNCTLCHSSCATCNGSSNTSCVSCSVAYLFVTSNQSCMVDSCPSSSVFFTSNNSCLMNCPQGYYNNSGMCSPCHSTCESCFGGLSTNCLTCQRKRGSCSQNRDDFPSNRASFQISRIYFPPNNSCLTSCPLNGYYNDKSAICIPCDPSCLSCFGPSATDCISCPAGTYWYNYTCVPSCPDGVISIDMVCQADQVCDFTCATCTGPSATECLTCPANRVFYQPLSLCLLECPYGYYNYSGVCSNARHPHCGTCNGPLSTNCLSCPSNLVYFSQNSSCLGYCPNGYYNQSGICKPCDPSCLRCYGPLSTNCHICPSSLFLVLSNNSCAASCPSGTVNISTVCYDCDPTCATCSGIASTNCLTCPSGTALYSGNNTCLVSCPDSYYNNGGICSPCNSSCVTCNGPHSTNCTSCTDGYFLNSGNCSICDSTCLTCSGGLATNCTNCQLNLVYFNNLCIPNCPAGFSKMGPVCCADACEECDLSSPYHCITCYSPTRVRLYLGSDNMTCVTSCPSGYWNTGAECSTCNASCATCIGPNSTNCTSCSNSSYVLSSNTCVTACPTGTVNASKICMASCPNGTVNISGNCGCNSSCATCTGTATYCSTCPSGKVLVSTNHTCLSSCPSGFYNSLGICLPCSWPCATCAGPSSTNCLSCSPTTTPSIQTRGVCVCSDGYFNNSGTCSTCDSSCATCNGPSNTDCLTCPSSTYYFSDNGTCLGSCPDGYYSSNQNSEAGQGGFGGSGGQQASQACLACDPSCATCSGSDQYSCLTCPPGLYVISDGSCTGNCDPSCASCNGTDDGSDANSCITCYVGFYLNTDDNSCPSCDSSCATCIGSDAKSCLTCSNSLFLSALDNSCVSTCPDGTFENDDTQTCDLCDPSCVTCTGPDNASCIACNRGYARGPGGSCIQGPGGGQGGYPPPHRNLLRAPDSP